MGGLFLFLVSERLATAVMFCIILSNITLARPHICDATLLHVLLHWHTYVMLRYCTFSCTSTHTSCYVRYCTFSGTSTHMWCYATVPSPALAHICDATLLYVLLHWHTYVTLCYCTFSGISTQFHTYMTDMMVMMMMMAMMLLLMLRLKFRFWPVSVPPCKTSEKWQWQQSRAFQNLSDALFPCFSHTISAICIIYTLW